MPDHPVNVSTGFFGKLPSRGDFLRYRLPDATVDRLDGWIARNLGSQQHRHGAAFDAIWERAPIWRFSLDAGQLDPLLAASGIWMPSIDKAGRCFPLVLLMLHPNERSVDLVMDALQPTLQSAVQWDMPPETLREAIDAVPVDAAGPQRTAGDLWWRPAIHDGSPVTLRASLPDGDGFDLLLQLLPQERATLS